MFRLNKIEKSQGYYELYNDGKICDEVLVYQSAPMPEDEFEFLARNYEGSQNLLQCQFKEFRRFSIIELKNLFEWLEINHWLIISNIKDNRHSNKINLTFGIAPDLVNWEREYSFAFYITGFEAFWDKEGKIKGEVRVVTEESAFIEISFEKELVLHETIAKSIFFFEQELHLAHKNTKSLLASLESDSTVSTVFVFPEHVKNSCEQYLLYFAQFLQDLGINTTSNLKEEAGKVLFSVTPTDDVEALDKIREALAVYLNLPASPIEYNDSFAAMRLQQTIENLQHSQRMMVREIRTSERELRLAQTAIEHQDKIILQKDSLIEQKDKIIEKISSKSIMTDSLENKEKLYEGLEFVPSEALKKYLGVIFQPVTFFKQLGSNLIGSEKENLSILQSEETEKND